MEDVALDEMTGCAGVERARAARAEADEQLWAGWQKALAVGVFTGPDAVIPQ